jgi:hypothetical protein
VAIAGTVDGANGTLDRAEALVSTVQPLLDAYRPALTDLAPVVGRFAAELSPEEVQAFITLVDRVPALVVHLDEDVMPVMVTLGDVVPDVHDLLDTVQDIRQVVKGFPGSRLFRRRGAEEIAAEEEAAGED